MTAKPPMSFEERERVAESWDIVLLKEMYLKTFKENQCTIFHDRKLENAENSRKIRSLIGRWFRIIKIELKRKEIEERANCQYKKSTLWRIFPAQRTVFFSSFFFHSAGGLLNAGSFCDLHYNFATIFLYEKIYKKKSKYYTESFEWDYSFYITLITKKLNLKLSLIVYNNFTLIHTKKRRMAEMLL